MEGNAEKKCCYMITQCVTLASQEHAFDKKSGTAARSRIDSQTEVILSFDETSYVA